MSNRNRNNSNQNGILNEESTQTRKIKNYQAFITIAYKEPPIQEVNVRARSLAEATAKALELGKQFIQADIVNAQQDIVFQLVEKYKETGELDKATLMEFAKSQPNQDDFDINGLVIAEKEAVTVHAHSEDELANKMHDDIQSFLREVDTKKEEE